MVDTPQPGYSLTLKVDLDALPGDHASREELERKLTIAIDSTAGFWLW